ncbi:MAG: glycosyltransferase family 4 protein [Cyclobacteriaceae bacterium]|nr:glycosyltransferase family 4 protein [Cyclobacteriaceae bacterium]
MQYKERSIVFINQATGYLTIDIVNAFVDSGKFSHIALIAGSVRVQDIPLSSSVGWSKIILYNRGNPFKKFTSWAFGTIQIFFLLLTKYRKYEVFYVTIPPFAYLLSLFLKNRFSILVYDVYPDVLKIYNIRETNLIYKLWVRWNKRLFLKSFRLYSIGEGMVDLLEKYVSRTKINIINNWTGLTQLKHVSSAENSFLKDNGLENKFVVMYSGNIGVTHNVEVLLDIARKLEVYKDIVVLVIGRGDRYFTIKKQIESSNLNNCKIMPFQPDELLQHVLSSANVGVVLLDSKTPSISVPSKIYNLQAVGLPILGIAEPDSTLDLHLRKYENGQCFSEKEVDMIIEYILKLKLEPELYESLSQSSFKASKDFTMLNALSYVSSYV